ncbi:MAG: VapE domain-containing protein [Clostridia bacterium]
MKNVTLADIANKTGFSVNTVSHALHDKKDISAKTKEQIQAVAKEMGYIRNSSASSLRSGKTKSIAIIVGDISNPHFSIMIKEMETLFRKKGYTSFILNTDEDEEMEWTAITSAISKNVDGIILCPVQKTEGNVRYLMETGIPFTLIGRRFDQIPTNYVVCDDENGGYLAASYLLSENHRRILFLNGGAYISSAKERLLGIQRAFVEKGTPLDLACSLQSKGFSDEAIIAAIQIENEKRCDPPLSEKELEKTIQSALKYEKGTKIVNSKRWESPKPCMEQTVNLRYDENGKVQQTIENICEVLRNDPALKNHLRYNTLSYSPFIFGAVPWSPNTQFREWNNADDSNLKCYVEGKYGLKNMEKIMEAFTVVVNEHPFNPVADYLESLIWDQKPHIENLLPDFLGVAKSRYSVESMKLFMLGAINRAYHPGCKFDYMLVLVGEQGAGKSTFFKLLAGRDEWYNDNFNTIDGDKAAEKLRGMWIVELAELLAVKKAQQVESIKAFITSTVDTYRPPYGRRTEQRPRVCVFAGTTNSSHFLTDRTGNRRYLPLLVNKRAAKRSMFEQPDKVAEEFRQAWAEAFHIYRTENPALVLPCDLQEEVKEVQNSFVEEDVRVGIIQEWLDNTTERYVCIAMVYKEALNNEFTKPDRRTSNELHDIMQHSIRGWRRMPGKKKFRTYGAQISYERCPNTFWECYNETLF